MSKKANHSVAADHAVIFSRVRLRIAQEIERDDLVVRPVSSPLELAISTFAPSTLLPNLDVSDYPFVGARYVSVLDGYVYSVYGATDNGKQLVAYRMPFFRSIFTQRGGIGVGIDESAWMRGRMILFSINHAGFNFANGDLTGISEFETRRAFPLVKLKAYWFFVRSKISKAFSQFKTNRPSGE